MFSAQQKATECHLRIQWLNLLILLCFIAVRASRSFQHVSSLCRGQIRFVCLNLLLNQCRLIENHSIY